MANNEHFVYNPSTIDIGRSKFLMNNYLTMPIYHGDLVPLEITPVMPGDSVKYDISLFLRTATNPIVPFMDSVHFSVAAFYVPTRLVFGKEKEYLGENIEGYGIQTEILAPRDNGGHCVVAKTAAVVTYPRSIATNLGLVTHGTVTNPSPIALNPIRAFLQVYNDWFRNENFHSPYLWDHSQTGDASRHIATLNGRNIDGISDLPKVCKQLDRYTSCLPWAQKGLPVLIGMTGAAPFGVLPALESYKPLNMSNPSANVPLIFGNRDSSGLGSTEAAPLAQFAYGVLGFANDNTAGNIKAKSDYDELSSGVTGSFKTNLVADLSKATATSINEFRLAFATQRYLEQLARSGSKYREYIKAMFGVTIGDTTAQMAEYLGGMTMTLNIDQVLQTTGFVAGGSTELGAPGAVSCSAVPTNYLFTKSFDEPGFLVIVGYAKHNRTYGQGIDEVFKKHELLEDYNPKFANIGEQAIHSYGLFFTGDISDDDDRFGFQEAWSEYRHKKDEVRGALNPALSSSLNFWSLADNYATKPVLNADFITEDRDSITRCLAGGSSSPDYFLNVHFNRTFVRPMPLYSIPGLIDHH